MKKVAKRIIVMGGSFNPPTSAHYKLMLAAVDALGADLGFFVPVSDAYLKRKMKKTHPPVVLSEEMRVKMLQAICAEDKRLNVCTKELGLIAPGTTDTMIALQKDFPEAELYFVLGGDKLTLLVHLTEKRAFLDYFKVVMYSRNEDNVDEFLNGNEILSPYKERIVVLPQPDGTEGVSSSKVRDRMLSGESSEELLCPGVWELFKDFTPANFPDVINRFSDEYAFLANSFKCRMTWQGQQFRCAGDAYKFSRDSDTDDLEIMASVVEAKFEQNPDLKKKLADTRDQILINGNGKKETYWGVDLYSWEGENLLGKILMTIRDKEKLR